MKVPVTGLTPGMVLANGQTVVEVETVNDEVVIVRTRDSQGDVYREREQVGTEYEVEAIDLTPSWSALVPIFVGVLRNDEAPVSAHKQAEASIAKMAELADRYVQVIKTSGGNITGITPVLTDPDKPEGRA